MQRDVSHPGDNFVLNTKKYPKMSLISHLILSFNIVFVLKFVCILFYCNYFCFLNLLTNPHYCLHRAVVILMGNATAEIKMNTCNHKFWFVFV